MADKTLAVVHYPNLLAPPQGIWWWDGSSPRLGHFYADKDFEPIGAERMGVVAGNADAVEIEDFFDSLASSFPRPDVWEVVTLGAMTGPEYLRHELRQFKKKAA